MMRKLTMMAAGTRLPTKTCFFLSYYVLFVLFAGHQLIDVPSGALARGQQRTRVTSKKIIRLRSSGSGTPPNPAPQQLGPAGATR